MPSRFSHPLSPLRLCAGLLGVAFAFFGVLGTAAMMPVAVKAQQKRMVKRTQAVVMQPVSKKQDRIRVAEFYYLRGLGELKSQDYGSSIVSFGQTKSLLDKEDPTPTRLLRRSVLYANAYTLWQLRRIGEAKADLRTLLKMDTENVRGRYLLGVVLFEEAQKESIDQSLAVFLKMAENRSVMARDVGRKALVRYAYNWSILLVTKKDAMSYKVLENILRKNVLNKRDTLQLTYTALLHRGHLGQTVQAAGRLVKLQRENVDYSHQNLRPEQAAANFYYQHSVELLSKARSAGSQQMGQKALNFAEKALVHDATQNAKIWHQKYLALMFLKRPAQADRVRQDILAADPNFFKAS